MTSNSNALARLTSYLPVDDHELFDLVQEAKKTFWTEDEIDFSYDLVDWETKLSDTKKKFISHILGFFVQSDQLVNINLGDRFLKDIENIPNRYAKYSRMFYNLQMAIEDIHTLTYESMLNEFIANPDEQSYFKNAIANIPAIAQKAEWAIKYIDDKNSSFLVRLIAFAILEGIFFSGSFCSIFWLGESNLMRGLIHSNKFISRDENLHYKFALTLYRKLKSDPEYPYTIDETIINTMIIQAVEIESQFINESISCDMIGMNTKLMTEYIQFVADTLLTDIDMNPIYNVKNPFSFMVNLGLTDKCNFFESRETVYQKPTAGKLEYDSDNEF
jgi:ribonucleoside-diphosphate reductase subunit M2